MLSTTRGRVVTAVVLSAFAAASYGAAADVIKKRQQTYKDLGAVVKKLGEALKTSAPQASQLDQYTAQIADLAKTLGDQEERFFAKGTGPEAGVKTNARKEIWGKPQEFHTAMRNLTAEAGNLKSIPGSNIPGLKAQFRKLGAACKSCHDSFREKDD